MTAKKSADEEKEKLEKELNEVKKTLEQSGGAGDADTQKLKEEKDTAEANLARLKVKLSMLENKNKKLEEKIGGGASAATTTTAAPTRTPLTSTTNDGSVAVTYSGEKREAEAVAQEPSAKKQHTE